MKNRKNIILITISLITLFSLVAMFSFAYFAASTDVGNDLPVNVTIEDGTPMTFTAKGKDAASVTVSGDKMMSNKVGQAGSDTAKIDVSLQSKTNVKCTYDIYWEWDSASPSKYTKTSGATNEFTIQGSAGTLTLAETQLPNSTSNLKLGTYTIATNNTTTTQSWTFTAKFYNRNVVQDAHAGATYKGKVSIKNAVCGANV